MATEIMNQATVNYTYSGSTEKKPKQVTLQRLTCLPTALYQLTNTPKTIRLRRVELLNIILTLKTSARNTSRACA